MFYTGCDASATHGVRSTAGAERCGIGLATAPGPGGPWKAATNSNPILAASQIGGTGARLAGAVLSVPAHDGDADQNDMIVELFILKTTSTDDSASPLQSGLRSSADSLVSWSCNVTAVLAGDTHQASIKPVMMGHNCEAQANIMSSARVGLHDGRVHLFYCGSKLSGSYADRLGTPIASHSDELSGAVSWASVAWNADTTQSATPIVFNCSSSAPLATASVDAVSAKYGPVVALTDPAPLFESPILFLFHTLSWVGSSENLAPTAVGVQLLALPPSSAAAGELTRLLGLGPLPPVSSQHKARSSAAVPSSGVEIIPRFSLNDRVCMQRQNFPLLTNMTVPEGQTSSLTDATPISLQYHIQTSFTVSWWSGLPCHGRCLFKNCTIRSWLQCVTTNDCVPFFKFCRHA
eukprot:SAG31_NODE_4833_length_2919_cov_2.040426_2_plen_407_part_00